MGANRQGMDPGSDADAPARDDGRELNKRNVIPAGAQRRAWNHPQRPPQYPPIVHCAVTSPVNV